MLTDKQERFAQCIALEGMNQADAYRECYDAENMKPETIWTEASLLASNQKVAKRIQELRDEAVASQIMSAIERKIWLSRLIQSDEAKVDAQLKACDILNKMCGEYVTKVEGNLNVKLEDLL